MLGFMGNLTMGYRTIVIHGSQLDAVVELFIFLTQNYNNAGEHYFLRLFFFYRFNLTPISLFSPVQSDTYIGHLSYIAVEDCTRKIIV